MTREHLALIIIAVLIVALWVYADKRDGND